MFIDGDRMQSHFNMVAETCVVEPERDKRNISGQRSEPKCRRNTVGADRVPHGHALNCASVMEGSPSGE